MLGTQFLNDFRTQNPLPTDFFPIRAPLTPRHNINVVHFTLVLTEQCVLRTVRSLPDDADGVVRSGLRGERDPRHHPAGHELQLPTARRRGARHGHLRQRPRPAGVSHERGILPNPGPVGPVQDGRHVRGDVPGVAERPVLHVRRVQGRVVRDAPAEAQHQTVAAAQARVRRPLHQGQL